MSVETQRRPAGDPAFEGDHHITHEPVVEEERREVAHPERLRSPVTWTIVGATAGLLALAMLAGATVGWSYVLPFAVVAVLAIVFVAVNRAMAEVNRRRDDDPMPDITFEKRS